METQKAEAKKSKVKLIIDISSYVLIGVVLFFAIIFLSVAISSRKQTEIPSLFGTSVLTVESDSMKPLFKKGDLIKIQKLTSQEALALEVDDIITFEFVLDGERAYNTHRIVEVGTDEYGKTIFKTKGDANDTRDQDPVSYVNVVGKYVGKQAGGRFVNFLRSGAGFFVCIILPLLLFFAYRLYILIKLIIDIRKEKRGELEPAKGEDYDALLKEVEALRKKVGEPAEK